MLPAVAGTSPCLYCFRLSQPSQLSHALQPQGFTGGTVVGQSFLQTVPTVPKGKVAQLWTDDCKVGSPALPEPLLSLSVFGVPGVLHVPVLQPQGFADETPLKMLRVPVFPAAKAEATTLAGRRNQGLFPSQAWTRLPLPPCRLTNKRAARETICSYPLKNPEKL